MFGSFATSPKCGRVNPQMTRNIKEIVNHALPIKSGLSENAQKHVCVLLATYNGAKTLPDQLVSLARQSHTNWSMIVSDDGSSDRSRKIVQDFGKRCPGIDVLAMKGPRNGFAQNFMALVVAAGPHVPFAAFCDQDDVWKPGKLERALDLLHPIPQGIPAMYCSRTIICDANLHAQGTSPKFDHAPNFKNALVQNICSGNTIVLNRAALDLVQDTAHHAGSIVSHDWWVYQLVTGAGGQVIYDLVPSLLYRQHSNNAIGANNTFRASAVRLWHVCNGRFAAWNAANTAALNKVRHWLTPDAIAALDAFSNARSEGLISRIQSFRRSGIYRQTKRGHFALWLAAILGKL